jgi:prepilin-type N-terminal cleavage/methylation domain-containing protein
MKRAFTLLELTVVIAIVSVLTHLAVRELGKVRNTRLERAADRQLEEIRSAAIAFLDDVGRLPRLSAVTNGDGSVSWSLCELWRRPADVLPSRAVEKDGVCLAAGWNGPYLKLPFGKSRLLDPWGNPIELEDSARLQRLWADESGEITNVCHYGRTAQAAGKRELSLLPDGGKCGTLILSVDAGDWAGDVSCRWYAPHGSDVTNSATLTHPAGRQFVFEDVPCGRRMVRVSAAGTTVRQITVEGGVNLIELKAR